MTSWLFRVAYLWMGLLFALDILTTRQALAAGAYEWNRFAAPLFRLSAPPWLILALLAALKTLAWVAAVLLTRFVRATVGARIGAQFLLPAWAVACLGMTVIVAHNWLLAR